MVLTANYGRAAAPLAEVLPPQADASPGDQLPDDREWRPVAVSGHYLPSGTTLLRQRPVEGQAGFHVLVPFVVTGSPGAAGFQRVLLVDRGFVTAGDDGESADVPPPPTGTVDLVVHLRPGEDPFGRAPRGQTRSIDLPALADASWVAPAVDDAGGRFVTAAYGVLSQETPAPSSAPTPLPPPEVDEGPHLSYACQWWIFAVGGFVGYGVVARRHAEDLRLDAEDAQGAQDEAGAEPADGGTAPSPAGRPAARVMGARPERRRVRRARRPTAADEEDALLDALDAERQRPVGQAGARCEEAAVSSAARPWEN